MLSDIIFPQRVLPALSENSINQMRIFYTVVEIYIIICLQLGFI